MPEHGPHIFMVIASIGLSLALALVGAARLLGAGDAAIRRRVAALSGPGQESEANGWSRPLELAARLPGLDRTAPVVGRDLDAAGLGSPVYLQRFLGMQVLVALAAGLMVAPVVFDPAAGMAWPVAVGYALAAVMLGFYLPRIWLDQRARQRLAAITLSLPDLIDLLVVCIEAGMGLDHALARVAVEKRASAPELSAELQRLSQEIRTGRPRAGALRALSERLPVPDLAAVVGVMLQSERMGTPVGGPLRGQAQLLRTRRRQRAERRAHEATVKLIIPLVFCIFPVILLLLLGPAVYGLLQAFGAAGGVGGLGG